LSRCPRQHGEGEGEPHSCNHGPLRCTTTVQVRVGVGQHGMAAKHGGREPRSCDTNIAAAELSGPARRGPDYRWQPLATAGYCRLLLATLWQSGSNSCAPPSVGKGINCITGQWLWAVYYHTIMPWPAQVGAKGMSFFAAGRVQSQFGVHAARLCCMGCGAAHTTLHPTESECVIFAVSMWVIGGGGVSLSRGTLQWRRCNILWTAPALQDVAAFRIWSVCPVCGTGLLEHGVEVVRTTKAGRCGAAAPAVAGAAAIQGGLSKAVAAWNM